MKKNIILSLLACIVLSGCGLGTKTIVPNDEIIRDNELTERKEIIYNIVNGRKNYSETDLMMFANRYRNDFEVMITLIRLNANTFIRYCSENLLNDTDIMAVAVKQNGELLKYGSDDIRNNSEITLLALKNKTSSSNYISKELFSNKEFVINAMNINESVFQYSSNEIKSDKEFLFTLLENTHSKEIIRYASSELRNDKNFKEKVYHCNGFVVNKENCLSIKPMNLEVQEQKIIIIEKDIKATKPIEKKVMKQKTKPIKIKQETPLENDFFKDSKTKFKSDKFSDFN